MAEPSMLMVGKTKEKDDESEEEDAEQTAKKGKRISFSKLGESGLCPHKAFPSPIKKFDRKTLKTQLDYSKFLMKNPSEGLPWFSIPPKIKFKKRTADSLKWLAQARNLKVRAKLPEHISDEKKPDMSYYIVMKQPCKRKKKIKKECTNPDYEIKVNKELAFMLDIIANGREVMIQKAIDLQRQKEEEERKGREEGDIKVLKKIVHGMMIKVLHEYAESAEEKPKKKKDDKKRRGKCKKCCKKRKESHVEEYGIDDQLSKTPLMLQLKKCNENTTKELISFLKDLIERDQRRRCVTTEEKSISPYMSEEFVAEYIFEEDIVGEIIEEEDEEEEEEDDEEGEGEEGEGDGTEGAVDMNEVKKKLEDYQSAEENEEEGEEEEDEEGIEKEPSYLIDELLQPVELNPSMSDKSAQFNYFLERKALFEKKPKNITDDLVLFLKTLIMGDDNLKEILREKELLEFKRKKLDFMTMGMLLNKPEKVCKKKVKKGMKRKKKVCKNDDVSKDKSYCIRPNEFMLMLEVVMNSLELIELQEKSHVSELPSVISEEMSEEGSEEDEEETEEEEEEDEEEEDEEEEEDDDDDDDVD